MAKKSKDIQDTQDTQDTKNIQKCNIVVFDKPTHLDAFLDEEKLKELDSHWIFLWCNSLSIIDTIEVNHRVRKIQQCIKDTEKLAEISVLDLRRAGFPSLTPEEEIQEYQRIAGLYLIKARERYVVEVFNFLEIEN